MTTNYTDAFIAVSPDCPAAAGAEPKSGTVAALQLALLREQPYGYTSDDLLFEVHARRNGVSDAERTAERLVFFAKPRACLRASPLVRSYGWGLHHDAHGRVAAHAFETHAYDRLTADPGLKQTRGMRSRRA